ncbi:MAG TPA: glycoside hydrolase family 3 protein [Steroidobacteraceae bacterium]|nr:glycoside hydrolase family 3 protein [Steroidobacteraceae bacterium]
MGERWLPPVRGLRAKLIGEALQARFAFRPIEVIVKMMFYSRSGAHRCLGLVSMAVCGLAIVFGANAADDGPSRARSVTWPSAASTVPQDPRIEARIADLLRHLNVEQKVAQMVQADIRYVTPEDVKTYRLGSVLNGGGAFPGGNRHATVADWVGMVDRYYDASMDSTEGAPAIPVIWGTDAVHGHNNVFGATLFPHNIGLGAAHDPELIERIGRATAAEVAATGIDWTFAPTLAVVRDDRWGRTYEGYSEQPDIVRTYAGRMVQGLQGAAGTPAFLDAEHIVATAKHFIGDGGTYQGIDRGDNRASEEDLLAIHGQGYVAAIHAGVQTVMVSYNSWQGIKMHGQHYLITDVLKGRMGFDGLVVSDWDAIDEVQSCSKDKCAQAVSAGVDLFMVPEQWRAFIQNTVAQVRNGDIPEARIDDAVSRILRVKLRSRLFEKGRPSSRPLANRRDLIGAPEHRAVAREAVRKSLVLLKNDGGLLPLRPQMKVLVAGDGADDIGKQAGGWTLTWQGTGNSNVDFPGATSIFQGIRDAVSAAGGTATLSVNGSFNSKPDVAIVVFGENPYSEWHGDIRSIDYRSADTKEEIDLLRPAPESPVHGAWSEPGAALPQQTRSSPAAAVSREADLALLMHLRQKHIPVVAVFLTGRPRGITPELNASNAFVVAWLPGSEGGGIADVLFRNKDGVSNFDFTGRLSFSWPRGAADGNIEHGGDSPLFPYGFGLAYCNPNCDAPLFQGHGQHNHH